MTNMEKLDLDNVPVKNVVKVLNGDNKVSIIAYKLSDDNALVLSVKTTITTVDGEEVVNKSIDFSVCDIITKTDTFLFNTDNVKDLNNISSLFSEIKKNLVQCRYYKQIIDIL